MMRRHIALTTAAAAALAVAAAADTVTIEPSKDNTLIESEEGLRSNGAGDRVFCGRTNQGKGADIRRAILAFDVGASVPAGSTITSVTLNMQVVMALSGPADCTLHRVQQDWGEAGSNAMGGGGGGGTFPHAGDTTWIHTFYDDVVPAFWTNAGGDYDAAASATATGVGGTGAAATWSGGTLVSDVQDWLDEPATNFGWVVIGDERATFTAKAFGSREADLEDRPTLQIDFDPPDACDGDTNGDGSVNVNDLNNVILDWGTDGSANGGDITGPVPGSPPDGIVNVNDLNAVIVNWGVCP